MTEYKTRVEYGNKFRDRLRVKRKEVDFTQRELAEYLHKKWDIAIKTTQLYIRKLETRVLIETFPEEGNKRLQGGKCLNPQTYDKTLREHHQQRISDYLSALGCGYEEAIRISDGVGFIDSKFKYVHSDVKPYNPI